MEQGSPVTAVEGFNLSFAHQQEERKKVACIVASKPSIG
jgi:hypothetical protein